MEQYRQSCGAILDEKSRATREDPSIMSDKSTSFDAGRLQWLCRARQMEAQRYELERVARWKLLSSGGGASPGAAAPGTTTMVMVVENEDPPMLDTSVDSEESFGSSTSESLSPLSKQARPETLQALRSLSSKHAEIRGPSLFDSIKNKAESAAATTDQERPPLLKLASSGMTMGGDDRSTASSRQEKHQQQPPPLEDWAAILQLGYLMLGSHRGRAEEVDTAAESSEPVDLDTGQSDARESACQGAELPDKEEQVHQDDDKATPYPACVGALGMSVAAGMLVAAHDYFRLLDVPVPSVPHTSFANSTESFWIPSKEALSEHHIHSLPFCLLEEALHDNTSTATDHVQESLTVLFSRDVLYPMSEQCWWDDGSTLVVDGEDGGVKGEGTTIPAALVPPLVVGNLLDEEFPCPSSEEDDNEVDRDNEEAFTTPQSPSSASRTEKRRRFRPWRAFHEDSLLRKIIDRLLDGGPKQRQRRRTWDPENMVDDWLKVVTYHFEGSRRR